MRRFLIVVTLLASFGASCAAIRQQKQMPQRADQSEFKNLRLLHPESRDQLITIMRNYSRALGVRCEHCHVQVAPAQNGEREKMDFASDAKPEKDVARAMITMTRDINQQYVSRVAEHGTVVSCYTCHRGKVVPESVQPPPPQQGAAPGGAQQPAPPPQPH